MDPRSDLLQIRGNNLQLGLLFSIFFQFSVFIFSGQQLLSGPRQHHGRRLPCRLLAVARSAVAGLEELVDLVASHLEIAPAGLGDIGSVRFVQHIIAVLPILHSQAETKSRIAPDIVIDGTAGLLGRQDQMHSQASSHLGDADQLLHELRLLPLQFRELIDDDEQVGNRFLRLMLLIHSGIGIDMVDAVLRQQSLASPVLALDGNHRSLHLIAGQVRDLPRQVRQAGKEVRHATALEVDDKEGHILRAEIQRQGENIGLQGFTLSGACRTCHQAVGAVVFFMQIEITEASARLLSDRHPHRLVISAFLPALLHM